MNNFWDLIAEKTNRQNLHICYCDIIKSLNRLNTVIKSKSQERCIFCEAAVSAYDADFAVKNLHEPEMP